MGTSKTQTMKAFLTILLFLLFSLAGLSQNLTGRWKLDVDMKEIGPMQILLDFTKTSDSTFIASSRPKALKNIIGGIKYSIAKNKTRFKNGSIAHIYSGVVKTDDSLKGIFTTPIMDLYFSAHLQNGIMTGALHYKDKHYNEFKAIPYDKEFVDYDYVSLTAGIQNTIQKNIYDAEVLHEKQWVKFFNELDHLAPKIHDDLEMLMYFSFLSKKIKMSHIGILKYNPLDSSDDNDTSKYTTQVSHKMINHKTAYIKFEGFQLADTLVVREFFTTIIEQKVPILIFDLRGCSGGDYSSMFLAQYLTKETHEAGFFIGNKYYQTNRKLPDDPTIKNLPDYNGKSLKEFLQVILESGLLKGSVAPDRELHYNGNVYALIDNHSASATEPIAYYLKQHKLATLVGETTAGQMLSSTVITVKDSWSLLIPIADYYTSDRFRIEQKGVNPNIKVKSNEALNYVLKIAK